MGRIFVDGSMAQFTRKDITLVDVDLGNGQCFENLEPRRLFPVSDPDRYITLLDESGIEQAVIRDLAELPVRQRQVIEDCLGEYYLVPKITRVISYAEKFRGMMIQVETDRGIADIELRTILHNVKLRGRRLLIRDSNDNRYEIPDITALDARSRRMIDNFI